MVKRFAVYVAVQLLAFALDFSVFWALFSTTQMPILANVLAKCCAGACAFFLHRSFTFAQSSQSDLLPQVLKYVTVLLLYIPASSLALFLLMEFFPPLIAKVVADVILVGLSFMISRYLIFK